MGMSPTKTGEMREDKFYLIKSYASWAFWDPVEGREVEPVTCVRTSYRSFQNVVNFRNMFSGQSVRYHGRRINDEVELFEWKDGKETPGLRKDLLSKGLTVRTYLPEPEVTASKFPRPTYKAAMGKDALPRTELQRCTDALKNHLLDLEREFSTKINYAILADAGKKTKTMIVSTIPEDTFPSLYDDGLETMSWEGEQYNVLGAIINREMHLRCTASMFTAFFKPVGDLRYHAEICFWDHAAEEARREWAAEKRRKKREKRLRQMASSSGVSTSENSVDSQKTEERKGEDWEAIRARQKEKKKAKQKALKEKKKQQKEETETVDGEVTRNAASSTDKEGNGTRQGVIEILGRCGSHHLIVSNDGDPRLVQILNLLPNDKKEETATTSKSNATQDDDNATTVSDGSSGTGDGSSCLRIVRPTTIEDIRREVREAKGPVFVAGPGVVEDET